MDKIWICVDCAYRSEYSDPQNDDHELDYLTAQTLLGAKPQLITFEDGELDEIHFSKHHCEFCGDVLAGARYGAILERSVSK